MPPPFHISKKIKWVIFVSTITISVTLSGTYWFWSNVREAYQLQYQTLQYNFPDQLLVNKLQFGQEDLFYFSADTLAVRWGWAALFGGHIEIPMLHLHGLDLQIHDLASDNTGELSLPPFMLRNTRLDDINIQLISAEDTFSVQVNHFRMPEASLQEEIRVDSLLLEGAMLIYRHSPDTTAKAVSTDAISFSVVDLPDFRVNHIGISESAVDYRNHEQVHQLKDLNLTLNGWNNNKLLNFQMDSLSFIYQDTLDFKMNLAQGLVSDLQSGWLEDIRLQIPGLSIHIAELLLQNEGAFKGALALDPSSLSFGALKSWYPDIMLAMDDNIPDDSLISFNGRLRFDTLQLNLDSLKVQMLSQTRTNIQGVVDWSANTLQFNFAFDDLHTSRDDLTTFLLPYDYNEFFNWPSLANGKASLNGNPDFFDIQGQLSTPEGSLIINSKTTYDQLDNLYYTINLQSDAFKANQLIDYLPVFIPQAQLDMTVEGLQAKGEEEDYFQLGIHSDHLEIEGRKLQNIDLTYFFNNSYDSLWAKLNDPLAKMDMRGALYSGDTSELTYEGMLSDFSSHLLNDTLPEQYLSSYYQGSYRWLGVDFYAIGLDTWGNKVQSGDSMVTLLPEAKLMFQQNGHQISSAIRSEEQKIFSLISDTSLFTLDPQDDDWLFQIPNTEVFASLRLDSLFMPNFSGQPIAFDLRHLLLKKEGKQITAQVDAPLLQYEDLQLQELSADIEANANQKKGSIILKSFKNPYTALDSLRIDLAQNADLYQLDVGGMLSDLNGSLSFGLDLQKHDSIYQLRLDEERPILLAGDAWQVRQQEGFIFDRNFSLQSADLQFQKDQNYLSFNSLPDGSMYIRLDSVSLADLLYVVDTSQLAEGQLTASLTYQPTSGELGWEAQLQRIVLEQTELGQLTSLGYYRGDSLQADFFLDGRNAQTQMHLYDYGEGVMFAANLSELDLSILKKIDLLPESMDLEGTLSGQIGGKLDTLQNAIGHLAFRDTRIGFLDYSSSFYIPTDSLHLENSSLLFKNFTLHDVEKRPLTISGSISLMPEVIADLEIKTEEFRLLDDIKGQAEASGNLKLKSDMSVTGGPENLTVFGNMGTLPGASIRYRYQGDISISDVPNIVNFVEFEEPDQEEDILRTVSVQYPVNWNVNLNIANTNLEIILNELSQENVKLSGGGEIRLRPGNQRLPMVYGNITARNGSATIFPPMVPDLNLNIELASLDWQGDALNPSLSFKGTETVKASPRGLSTSLKDRYDLVDFQVLLSLGETSLDNLAPSFDLQSSDGTVNTYLQGLGPEQREKYAIDLLVFGNIASESVARAPRALETVVSKMNEIASRNFKKTDVSFGVVQYQKPGEGPVASTQTSVNYKISRQLLHDRMFLSIGGNVGSYQASNAHLIGNMEVGYRLSQQPEISMIGARKHVYEGVIDGDIVRSSVGLNFRKSYVDWHSIFHSKQKGSQ